MPWQDKKSIISPNEGDSGLREACAREKKTETEQWKGGSEWNEEWFWLEWKQAVFVESGLDTTHSAPVSVYGPRATAHPSGPAFIK